MEFLYFVGANIVGCAVVIGSIGLVRRAFEKYKAKPLPPNHNGNSPRRR